MAKYEKRKTVRLTALSLGTITRLLRTVRNLRGKVYVVGGILTEGVTLRDLDIVVSDTRDIPVISKALGKFKDRAHFIHQKKEPPAPMLIKITGIAPDSPDKFSGKGRLPKFEYAGPC